MEEEEDGLLSNNGGVTGHGRESFYDQSNSSLTKQNNLLNQVEKIEEADQEEEDEDGIDENLDTEQRERLALNLYDYEVMPGPEKIKLQCIINDIRFDTQNLENENPGFSVRLETIPDKKD